ncbi:hypothetical protein JOF28_002446 [Leucobacter exalbidus]|uniref:Uncharacterized protein n=1 Tax=Leucobacter exalbidus TaxID=662960 RepID=A0A940PTH9_9MICO|nr:GlcNAc-transferase family protein [Leucobacter exalbidus]MBP1327214.1 hypothetical protein [Leucobacter exalbidus]
MSDRKILVKIASYRDPELVKTIDSALAAAEHPEHINFAIVNQVSDETRGQLDAFREDPRFRVTEIDAAESLDPRWAQRICDQMWSGQEFTLQLAAPTRFLPGWDRR